MTYRCRLVCLFLLISPFITVAQPSDKPATIATKVAGATKLPGYFTLYWDEKAGKLWLEIDKWNTEFLYVSSLATGIGSNDIGLDRGQLGGERIVTFQRVGPKVLLVQPNYQYRAVSDNADERRAVEESFAQSILWGFTVEAEDGKKVLVDATKFVLRDAHDVAGQLRRAEQGSYQPDETRSAVYLPRTKSFPQNTEMEATLTFTGNEPGNYVQQTVPTPQAITVRQHHSFIQLPDTDYQPRAFDPRSSFSGVSYMDYATPIEEPITKRFIARHRLKKKNPQAAVSEPVEPIVYYMDRGAPEPIRSALIEGARWWNQAFEAAGYQDAFRVELMPEGADPMDVRYNLIQWVHRATRGWSYGASVTDPRTGEIIKGHVTLGSLRVRQDYLIAEGLLAPYQDGKSVSPAMKEMALARLRQLSAHEVGHTIGLAHNYISSTENRASVMDYPHPLVELKNGKPDLSNAYATGIGEWDKVAVTFGYQDFPPGTDEKPALNKIITDAIKKNLIFLTDKDARPQGSAHPATHLWDNGKNAADELNRMMQVRKAAMEQFSEQNIRPGAPMSDLEDVLVPLYMSHRYQTEAAAKVVGGLYYTNALRGDGQKATEMVSPKECERALDALLATITPDALAVPERIVQLIPPRAFGYAPTRELFDKRTGMTFDPMAVAEVAADHTIGLLLHPERAARLVEFHARDDKQPGLTDVMDKLISATWKSTAKSPYHAEIQRTVNGVVLRHLMALSTNENAPMQVRAVATQQLNKLDDWLEDAEKETKDAAQQAHVAYARHLLDAFEDNPKELNLPKPLMPPPGQPIGSLSELMQCEW